MQVDVGAEAMLNRRPEAVGLAREAGLGDDLVHPATISANLWTRGAMRPMPRTLMGVPTDARALADSGVISKAGLARMAMDAVLPATELGDTDVSVGWLIEERFGREVVDRLVEPLLGGVYAGHAREISARAAVPQVVALLDRDRSMMRAAAAATAPTTPTPPSSPAWSAASAGCPEAVVKAFGARRAHRCDRARPGPRGRRRLEPGRRPDRAGRDPARRRRRAGHPGPGERTAALRRGARRGAGAGPDRVRLDGDRDAGLPGPRLPRDRAAPASWCRRSTSAGSRPRPSPSPSGTGSARPARTSTARTCW